MKIYFNDTFQISHTLKEKVFETIVSELVLLKADNILKEENQISFKNETVKFRSTMSLMAIINNGSFKFSSNKPVIEIVYVSNTSILIEVLAIIVLIVLGITFNTFIFIFPLLLLLQIFVNVHIVRTGNKSLIKKILASLGEDSAVDVTQIIDFKFN